MVSVSPYNKNNILDFMMQVIQWYNATGDTPVYVQLFDNSKARKIFFTILHEIYEFGNKSVLTYYKVTPGHVYESSNRICDLNLVNQHYDYFILRKCVKQGGVISLSVFNYYMDNLFPQVQNSALGCHVRPSMVCRGIWICNIALLREKMTGRSRRIE